MITQIQVVGSAETGTGKTAAYVLPTLHRVYIQKKREEALIAQNLQAPRGACPLAIILCPSTELAEQVMEKTFEYAKDLPDFRIMGIYGALKTKSTQVASCRISDLFSDSRIRKRSRYFSIHTRKTHYTHSR